MTTSLDFFILSNRPEKISENDISFVILEKQS